MRRRWTPAWSGRSTRECCRCGGCRPPRESASGGRYTSRARASGGSTPAPRCASAIRSWCAWRAWTRCAVASTCCRPTSRRRAARLGQMAKGKGKRKVGAGDVASNRYASHRYELIERLECGIVLEGTEVKALRHSGAQLKDGYAAIRDGELWLHSIHIPPFGPASRENHAPERPRKLLLHRRELDRIAARTKERGLTLVPTRIYFSGE